MKNSGKTPIKTMGKRKKITKRIVESKPRDKNLENQPPVKKFLKNDGKNQETPIKKRTIKRKPQKIAPENIP